MHKIATFINTENLVHSVNFKKYVHILNQISEVYISDEKAEKSAKNLYTGVDADYSEYDYVILINLSFFENSCSANSNYSKQKYYFDNLCPSIKYIESCIDILSNDKYCGILTPSIDYLSGLNTDIYKEWANFQFDIKNEFQNKQIFVPMNIKRPPVNLSSGFGIIKTKALVNFTKISNLEILSYKYVISLICQSNGYLVNHISTKNSIINNGYGYESHALWLEKSNLIYEQLCEQNSEYVKQRTQYFKEFEEYIEQTKKYFKEKDNYIYEKELYFDKKDEYIKEKDNYFKIKDKYITKKEKSLIKREKKINKEEKSRCFGLLNKIKNFIIK